MSKNRERIPRWFPVCVAVLALLGCVCAWILSVRSLGSSLGEGFCKVNQEFDCSLVTSSAWSSVFGISWAFYGLWFYACFFLYSVFWSHVHKGVIKLFHALSTLAASFAVVISVFLFLISKFVIGALCPYCVALYFINALLLTVCVVAGTGPLFETISNGWKNLFQILLFRGEKSASLYLFSIAISGILVSFIPGIFVVAPQVDKSAERNTEVALFVDEGVMGDYYLGKVDAPVRVVEFSDIQCPYCRLYGEKLDSMLKGYGDKVHFVFKNYPLDSACHPSMKRNMHPLACDAAEFARCAGEQGVFWRVLYDLYAMDLFEKKDVSREDAQKVWVTYAKDTSLDHLAIEECMQSDRQLERIRADIRQGMQIKISGTPTLIINGRVQKDLEIESVKKVIDGILNTTS